MRTRILCVTVTIVGLLATPVTIAHASDGLSMTGFAPSTGPVGTVVKITGSGFVAGDLVHFNGTSAVVSAVNGKGTKLTTSVPAFASSGEVTVTDPATGQTVGLPGDAFVVTTGLFPSPAHAWAGGHIVLAGSHLSPLTVAPITIGGIVVGEAQTDGFGDFQTQVTLPWDLRRRKEPITVLDPSLGPIRSKLTLLTTWPQVGNDVGRTSTDPLESTLSTSTVAGLGVHWRTDLANVVFSTPVVAGGLAYVTQGDEIDALDVGTGTQVWSYTTDDGVFGTPAVDNGIVYVGSEDGFLYALGASDGHYIWRYYAGGAVDSSPLVDGGVVYVGSGGGFVDAVGASDGHFIWTFETGGPVQSSPSIAGGVVYVGSEDDNLYALKATTGKKLWTFMTGGAILAPVTVSGGTVYVPSMDGWLWAVSTSTHARLWQASAGDADFTSVAVSGGNVYIGNDFFVRGLSASDGSVEWSYYPTDCGGGPPAYANGVVYVTACDTIYALGASDGFSLWAYTLPGSDYYKAYFSPSVANGVVYMGGATAGGAGFAMAFGL